MFCSNKVANHGPDHRIQQKHLTGRERLMQVQNRLTRFLQEESRNRWFIWIKKLLRVEDKNQYLSLCLCILISQ